MAQVPPVRPRDDELARERVARRAAESSRARILATVEKMSISVFVLDPEFRFRYVNRAAAALVGRAVEDLTARRLWDVFPESWSTELGRALRRAQAGGEEFELENYVSSLAGSPVLDVHGYPAEDGVWLLVRDVTERRRLEDSLRQSHRMESLGQLAGGLAHDFNNILTAIIGYADFALRDIDAGVDVVAIRSEVEQIKRASEQAAELTRGLLAYSRRQVLQEHTLDLNAVVSRAEQLLGRLIDSRITLEVSTLPRALAVEGNVAQLEQIVVNLALNARDAMPQGGTIAIRTCDADVRDEQGERLGIPAGRYAALSVEDNGVGIPEQVRDRIFDPFFTTKPAGEGTGLGLSTVSGIVRRFGGAIDLETREGVGTTFTIYLPAAESPLPGEPEPPSDEENSGTERVLLVEDNEVLRGLIREMLARRGYDVVVAEDARAAIAEEHVVDGFHLLVTDYALPGMSGVALADALRRRNPDLGVLLISGLERRSIDEAALGDNVSFLSKPFTMDEVASAVRKALDPG
jgi:two-component system, cell cycle sensor histidine kinase and response regulator CckA